MREKTDVASEDPFSDVRDITDTRSLIEGIKLNSIRAIQDTVLYISAPEITMRSGAMSSRLAQLMVIDALFTAVAHTDYDAIAVNLEKTHESICSHRVSGITYRFE